MRLNTPFENLVWTKSKIINMNQKQTELIEAASRSYAYRILSNEFECDGHLCRVVHAECKTAAPAVKQNHLFRVARNYLDHKQPKSKLKLERMLKQ